MKWEQMKKTHMRDSGDVETLFYASEPPGEVDD
jgi:hypothetical protein